MAIIGTGGRLEAGGTWTAITAAPFTMSAWVRPKDDVTRFWTVFQGANDNSNRRWMMAAAMDQTGNPGRFLIGSGGTNAEFNSSNGFTVNTWGHLCAVEAASNDHRVVVNGDWGNSGTSTTTVAPPGSNTLTISGAGDSTPFSTDNVDIAEVAFWNVALTQAEVEALAGAGSGGPGLDPRLVRPSALRFYAPLFNEVGANVWQDYRGKLSMSETGGTLVAAAHVPMIRRPRYRVWMPNRVAAGAAPAPAAVSHFQLLGIG